MGTHVTEDELKSWQAAIGRSATRSEVLDPESLRRFAAATGGDLDVERVQPSLAHWAFFLPVVAGSQIGEDGHPNRGGFLPAVTLPRRMNAGSTFQFAAPLLLGKSATRVSTIVSVNHKAGRSGDLVFVEFQDVITQDGAVRVTERQTLVYRDLGEPTPPVVAKPQNAALGDAMWHPGPVDLFRFSAVTFNSHRIHYDQPYVTSVEGYPGLIVHGPYTATQLHAFAQKRAGKSPVTFTTRAMAPLFASQPVRLTAGETPDAVAAIRCDGVTSMTATATF